MFEQYNSSEQAEDTSALQNQITKGASWFYWIAGASLVNTIIILFDGTLNFIVGLGVVQIISAIAIAIEHQNGAGTTAKLGAFILNAAISAVFAALGYYAVKGMTWAFIIGIVFYIFDGLIFIFFSDILSIGFHCFALFFIVKGYLAAKNLRKMQQATAFQPPAI